MEHFSSMIWALLFPLIINITDYWDSMSKKIKGYDFQKNKENEEKEYPSFFYLVIWIGGIILFW